MTRKNFIEGVNAILTSTIEKHKATNKIKDEELDKVPFEQYSLLIKAENLEKLRALAYWRRELIKDTVNEAFELFLNSIGEDKINDAIESYVKKKK